MKVLIIGSPSIGLTVLSNLSYGHPIVIEPPTKEEMIPYNIIADIDRFICEVVFSKIRTEPILSNRNKLLQLNNRINTFLKGLIKFRPKLTHLSRDNI